VHLKVDTGLHRIGLDPSEVVAFARLVSAMPGLVMEGLYTHLATADDADETFAQQQLSRFNAVIDEWRAASLPRPRYVHALNSAGALRFPGARFDLVRPGIALYGIDPGPETPLPATFRPALSLKTRIAQIRVVDAGETVSYGRAWTATSATRIGILPIGYGDGLRRGPSTWGDVLVRGRRAPLVGRVCMDMCMVDLNDSPDARPGDEVVLIGRQGMQSITADDVARQSGTSAYEVVCQILARVPREVVDPDTGWGT
jgi:alanine racemase